MMEPVEFAPRAVLPPPPDWAVRGDAETRKNLISSIYLEPDELEQHVRKLEAKYAAGRARRGPLRELCATEDADIVLVGYGIVGRILKAVVGLARGRRHQGRAAAADHAVPVPDRSRSARPGPPRARHSRSSS